MAAVIERAAYDPSWPLKFESERAFLVTAALAGAVASGDLTLAKALAEQQVPRLPRRDREGMQMQLLLGHLGYLAPKQ